MTVHLPVTVIPLPLFGASTDLHLAGETPKVRKSVTMNSSELRTRQLFRSSPPELQFFRCFVFQAAMRALLVVLRPPRRDLAPRVEQIVQPAQVQTLFPQPSGVWARTGDKRDVGVLTSAIKLWLRVLPSSIAQTQTESARRSCRPAIAVDVGFQASD